MMMNCILNLVKKLPSLETNTKKESRDMEEKMWWIPILGGEFILDRRFGFADGLMGGNLWFFGKTVESSA